MRFEDRDISTGGTSCAGGLFIVLLIAISVAGVIGAMQGYVDAIVVVGVMAFFSIVFYLYRHFFSRVSYCENCDDIFDYSYYENSKPCPKCDSTITKTLRAHGPDVQRIKKDYQLWRRKRIRELKKKLDQWESEGYDISKLKRWFKTRNLDEIEQGFSDFEEKIARLNALEEKLNSLSERIPQIDALKSRFDFVASNLKRPSRVGEVEHAVSQLEEQITEYENAGQVIDRLNAAATELEKRVSNVPSDWRNRIEKAKQALEAGKPEKAFALERDIKQKAGFLKGKRGKAEHEMVSAALELGKNSDYGSDTAEVETLVTEASSAFNEGKYHDACQKAQEASEKAWAIREGSKPDISLSLSKTDFEPNTWEDLELTLRNSGSAHAKKIGINLPETVEVVYLKEVPTLPREQEGKMSIRLKPRDSGKIPVTFDISFQDVEGNNYNKQHTVDFNVGAGTKPKGKEEVKGEEEAHTGFGPIFSFPTELLPYYEEPRYIAEGGMAWVYQARRKRDNKTVAIKIMKNWNHDISRSFMDEAFVWQSLDHPSIARIYDYAAYPRGYLEMEYLPNSLERVPNPLPPQKAASLIFKIAEGLKYAHSVQKPLLHLDLKPSNILLSEDGEPKIADWGMAKVLSFSGITDGRARGYTPLYAAPEQLNNERVDVRTDVFQLGQIFYELVEGKPPFAAESEEALKEKIKNEPPLPLTNQDARPLEPIILGCLEKQMGDRY